MDFDSGMRRWVSLSEPGFSEKLEYRKDFHHRDTEDTEIS